MSNLVCDFSPLRIARKWKEDLIEKLKSSNSTCVFHEVDAHNIVPVWRASGKLELAARTIRPKINAQLEYYLSEFPKLEVQNPSILNSSMQTQLATGINWEAANEIIDQLQPLDEVSWIKPGEDEALTALNKFVSLDIISYANARNDPNANAQSNLSPYLHFGQLSAQRAVLEANKVRQQYPLSVGMCSVFVMPQLLLFLIPYSYCCRCIHRGVGNSTRCD